MRACVYVVGPPLLLRAQRWPVPWKIVARMGPVEAKAYLREGPRLAVMPSRIENSPYTVWRRRLTRELNE